MTSLYEKISSHLIAKRLTGKKPEAIRSQVKMKNFEGPVLCQIPAFRNESVKKQRKLDGLLTGAKKYLSVFMILAMLALLPAKILAADDSQIGPVNPIGPQGQVGPSGTVGPTEPVGPQGQVGPQAVTGPTESSDQITSENTSSTGEPDVSIPPNENITVIPLPDNGTGTSSDTNININNDTDINNDADINLNTGDNNIGSNTAAGNIYTGTIRAGINLLNLGNINLAEGSSAGNQTLNSASINKLVLGPIAERINLTNYLTGPNSDNSNVIQSGGATNIFAVNNTDYNNDLSINANTGHNTIANNTAVGDIDTGDISIGANIINLAGILSPGVKLLVDTWNLVGNYVGNIYANQNNNTTGPNSSNSNLYSSDNDLNINSTRNTDINNAVLVDANTGENFIGNNTKVDGVKTGLTDIKNTIVNAASAVAAPVIYLVNVFGKWSGQILGIDPSQVVVNEVNQNTGPDSSNSNNINSANNTNINSETNTNINNQIQIHANTGNNTIENNSVVGQISTGAVRVLSNVINVVGQTREVTLRIINIFGNWDGNFDGGDGKGGGGNNNDGNNSNTYNSPAITPTISSDEPNYHMPSSGLTTLPVTGANLLN